jgi:formyl-CoA transferase
MPAPETDAPTTPPLDGIRVIELGVLLAGPFAGQVLGDLGAEVIKIESPGAGDPMRDWGQDKPYGKSVWWPICARNKKSVQLNLRSKEGQAALLRLVATADIVVENFRPGTLERWNLGYEQLCEVNPGIILVRVTGYGQTGPYAHRPGYASVGEAMGGLRYVLGYPDRAPARAGISIGDTLTGTLAALGGLAAIHERNRSGKGQVIDCAIYESVLMYMEALIPEYAIGGYIRERTGPILPNIAPSNVYPTADVDLIIAANQDTVFKRLAQAMGRPELADDPRYATHAARGKHQEELDTLIGEWTREWDSVELEAHLDSHAVPVGRINRAPEILADPHIVAREAIISMMHPDFGDFPMPNVFPRFDRTPGTVKWLGPEPGQHTDEVLGEMLGMSAEEISAAQAEIRS